jgi:spore coat polysaccharide biosynthesis protein SpsF (cytidylyltransferase family)
MMAELKRVAIGIQARSTSERLPSKVFADVCGKPMLKWVIDAAKDAAGYLNRPGPSKNIEVSVTLLIPTGDPIKAAFGDNVRIIEGDEHDVLSRYQKLAEYHNADYVVRITGDCPLIPPPVITKAVHVAVKNRVDYVSNVDERLRVSFDGMDCEVISRSLLEFAHVNATSKADREHVTTFMRRVGLPAYFTTAHIIGYVDLAGFKLSVDTEEDLERVRAHKAKILDALNTAEVLSGSRSLHRF